ncbi:MFS transporter [Carboxydothermus islandicus]|uniref:Bcr/CflA family efflux transporter n=1 Tax=Carboxydothermus islandicus TaxID=661089 RepID=A0A1L8D207_9THEO|nr:MFS transporter [Carboxydothermus islandicus]
MNTSTLILSRAQRLWLAIVLGALTSFAPLSIDMYLPSLPFLAKDLNTNISFAQLSLTACLVGLALGQLLAGTQSDIRGRRTPLIVGLIFYTFSSLLCSISTSIFSLVFLRFIQGLTGAAGIVIARAIVRDLYSGVEMMRFTAHLMLVNGLGPIVAPVIGAQLLHYTSWRGVFFILGLIGLVMFLIVFFSLPETLPFERRSQAGLRNTLVIYRGLIQDRNFMRYALPQGLVSAAMFAYIAGSPFVMQNIFGVTPQMFSLIFAINGLGIILAGQLTGRLAGRISGTTLFVSGLILAAIGGASLLIMVVIKAGFFAILIPLFIVVSCVGVVGTAGSALALENYGHLAGSASALLGLVSFIFGAIVAPLVGIGDRNIDISMAIVIAITDLSALLFYVLLRRLRHSD